MDWDGPLVIEKAKALSQRLKRFQVNGGIF